MRLTRSLGLISALAAASLVAACGSSDSSTTATNGSSAGASKIGNCTITSKPNSIDVKPVKSGTLTVETTIAAQGWWNGTTPDSIKDGYEYCMAAELANMARLSSATVKNVSFEQLVAGHPNHFDLALAEISITPERAQVVDFSKP